MAGKTMTTSMSSQRSSKDKGRSAAIASTSEKLINARGTLLRGGYLREFPPVLLPLGTRLVENIEKQIQQSLQSHEVRFGSEAAWSELFKALNCTYKELPMLIHTMKILNSKSGMSSACFEGIALGMEPTNTEIRDALAKLWQRLGLNISIVSDLNGERWFADQESGKMYYQCDYCHRRSTPTATSTVYEPFIQDGEEIDDIHDVLGENITGVYPLAEFLGIDVKRTTKTIIFEEISSNYKQPKVYAALIRGDHDVDAVKLACYAGVTGGLVLATPETVVRVTKCVVGYAGPINLDNEVTTIADLACKNRVNIECGANREHYHTMNANVGRDFIEPEYADLRTVKEGDICSVCCKGSLKCLYGIDLGGIRVMREDNDINYTSNDGVKSLFGLEWSVNGPAVVDAVVLQYHRDGSFIWPSIIAPYPVTVIDLMAHDRGLVVSEAMVRVTNSVLWDDRTAKIQRKMNDCDLVGSLVRVVVGSKMKEDMVEWSCRSCITPWTEPCEVSIDEATHRLSSMSQPIEGHGGWEHISMSPAHESLFRYLSTIGVHTQTYHHDIVLTCEAHEAALPNHNEVGDMGPFALTKSLLIKDRKANYYLIVALASTSIDFKKVANVLGVQSVRLADRKDVEKIVHVSVGHVTPFALLGAQGRVNTIIDVRLIESKYAGFHPLYATATTVIGTNDLMRMIDSINLKVTLLE